MTARMERLLIPRNEAQYVLGGIGHTKFYELVKDGTLPIVKIGGRTFIKAQALRDYVDSLMPTGGGAA